MVGISLSEQESLIQRRLEQHGVSREVVVVLICGLFGVIGRAYVALETWNGIEDPLPYLNFTLVGYVIGPILLMFGIWILYTVLSHFLANQAGGRGPMSRLSRGTAWSLIPIGIWLLVRSAVEVALFFSVDVPATPDGLTPQDQLDAVLDLGFQTPVYFVVYVAGILFVVWSWRLLSVSIANAKDIPREKARRLAVIPAAAVALFLLNSALTWAPF